MTEDYTTIYQVISKDNYKNHYFSTTSLEAAEKFAKEYVEAWNGQIHFDIRQVALYDSYENNMPVHSAGLLKTI